MKKKGNFRKVVSGLLAGMDGQNGVLKIVWLNVKR